MLVRLLRRHQRRPGEGAVSASLAKIQTRAALFAAPDTLVSADEVAAVMGVCKSWVYER